MKLDAGAELARAAEKIDQARHLRDIAPGLSMQQSYLAMFAAARARATVADTEFSDRGHAQLQRHLISLYRDDHTPANPGKQLQRAYMWKQLEDYGADKTGMPVARSGEEAREAYGAAMDFLDQMRADIREQIGHLPEPPSQEVAAAVHARLSNRDPGRDGGAGR